MWRATPAGPGAPEARGLLLEAAAIHRDRLDDAERARELGRWALELDPQNPEVGEAALEDAVGAGDWPRVREVATGLLISGRQASAERRAVWHSLRARAAEVEGDTVAALNDRRQAAALSPEDLGYLSSLASALLAAGQHAEAARTHERLALRAGDLASDAARAEVFHRLGASWAAVGERRRAIAALERALAFEPGRIATMEALAETCEAAGDVAGATKWKGRLWKRATDAARKVPLARDLSALLVRQGRQDDALKVLADTLVTAPAAWELLHDKLDLHVSLAQWRQAVDTLLALAPLCECRERARALVVAAQLLDRRMGEPERAVALYEEALDLDPADLSTFERIDRVLTRLRAWADQERSYRRMIARLAPRRDERARPVLTALWRGLGEIYRSRLGDVDSAIDAFTVAASLDPEDRQTGEILCELLERGGPARYERAIAERRRLIERAGDLPELARQLRAVGKLAWHQRDLDRARGAAEGLVALGVATGGEARLAAGGRPADLPRGALGDAGWARLRHPDQDPRLAAVLAVVGRALFVNRARTPRSWGLRTSSPVARLEVERSVLGRLLTDLGSALRVPRPDLTFRPDLPGTVEMVPLRYGSFVLPTFVAGADVLQVRSRRELVCLVGKKLALARPEHYALWPVVAATLAEGIWRSRRCAACWASRCWSRPGCGGPWRG